MHGLFEIHTGSRIIGNIILLVKLIIDDEISS